MTPFGKMLRHIRLERQMYLGEMADQLHISASYLSQIETGKRPIPDDLTNRVCVIFSLTDVEAIGLREAEVQSKDTFRIDLPRDARPQDRVLADELTRAFARLTPEAKLNLQNIVNGAK